MVLALSSSNSNIKPVSVHPIYVSVTEIEHNAVAQTLEIGCKLFIDDFEKTLRDTYKVHVDLLNPKNRASMEKLVNAYIQTHFKLSVNGKPVVLNFLGYEHLEEGIYSYFEVSDIKKPTQLEIFNNLLYEYKSEQMGIIHCKIKGLSKSTRLNNPNATVKLEF